MFLGFMAGARAAIMEENPLLFFGLFGLVVTIIGGVVKFSRWTSRVDTKLELFVPFMDEIRKDIKDLFKALGSPVTESASPIQLNEIGQRFSKQIGAADWARKVAADEIDVIKHKEPYQIHEFCIGYVEELFKSDKEEIEQTKQIRKLAYEAGISRKQLTQILTIELRDAFIKQIQGPA